MGAGQENKNQEHPWYAPKWADSLVGPDLRDLKLIREGKQLYHLNCIVCHGDKGRGDGESGFGLATPPGDLNDPFTINESDGSIFWKITYGRRPMLEYKEKLDDDERWALVAFIRALQRENQQKPEKHKPRNK